MEIDLTKLILMLVIPYFLLGIAIYFNYKNKPKWVIRKLIHVFGLTIFGIYGAFLDSLDEIIITLVSFLIIFIILSILPQIQLFRSLIKMGTREGEREWESMINTGLTSIVGLSLMVVALDERWLFLAGILSVAVGDGLGEFVGKPYGRHQYKIFATKSVEGSIGVFVGTFIGIVFSYVALDVGSLDISVLLIFFLAAFTAMVIEAFSATFFDNILLPYAVAGILWSLI